MKLVAISDTHLRHEALHVPSCDLLVHAGDCTRGGERDQLERFLDWFARQPAKERVFIAGNWDFVCEREPAWAKDAARERGVHYLVDEEVTVLGDVRVWGSPATPRFRNMAFNRNRGDVLRAHWRALPAGLDVLITHTPPKGIGDRIVIGARVGCEELRERLREAPPRVHVFGHIHEAAGDYRVDDLPTRFVNACSSPLVPLRMRPPVTIEL
jgi:Icc-related predicted phosphoesterase